jgi:hypothetical protein
MQKFLIFFFFASLRENRFTRPRHSKTFHAKTPTTTLRAVPERKDSKNTNAETFIFFFFASLRSSLRLCVKLFECRVKFFEWLGMIVSIFQRAGARLLLYP